LILFLFNIMAVVSYPDLTDVARQHHYYWGMLLAFLAVHGSGCLTFDRLLCKIMPWCGSVRNLSGLSWRRHLELASCLL
jgi:hypothetical protein